MKYYSFLTFFLYFSMGATLPLFSQYLQSIGLSGIEIGSIFSIGTFISILFQPFWGFIADKTNAIKKFLYFY
ncbi:MFS1 family protein [Hypnocyclicus thermotrophus]|uniref:MFS1 family protein n=1 Tax=Hypnocyclicus thermotrophus TaxID=1627895 RepID=A0AA46E0U9_9FUSO|nr:MFS1 family protein [Hypnocyclicus thermotrophus]